MAWLPFLLLAGYYAYHDVEAFEEARRVRFEERRKELFSRSMSASSGIISAIETESLQELIVSHCRELMHETKRMVFFAVDRTLGKEPIIPVLHEGFEPGTVERFAFPLDDGSSIVGRAIMTNEIQVVCDLSSRYWCTKAFVDACGLYRFVFIPFKYGYRRFGALLIEESEDLPTEHIISSLGPLKEQIPIALENRRLYEHVERISIRDELTGLYNRRFFVSRIEEEISRCKRYDRTMTVVMLDIDYFKRFNDDFGHQVGDEALRVTARTFMEQVRDLCVVARYGGDEFVILEPEATKQEAQKAVERLCVEVAKQQVLDENDQPTRSLTVSAGIAEFPADGKTSKELIWQADMALLYSKQTGRNRVTVAPAPEKLI